ncbi:hypothetical protein ES703_99983 [subsurface metagenome]
MGRVGALTLQQVKDNIKIGDLLADSLANLNTKVSDATLDTNTATRTPKAHEATHVNGGADDIDSALAGGAIPALATSKITSGRFPVDRLPALTDEKIWKGTGTNVEEIALPGRAIATGSYTGDGGVAGRDIPTGFKCCLVILVDTTTPSGNCFFLTPTTSLGNDPASDRFVWVHLHATDGFTVGDGGADDGNDDTHEFKWFAIEE